MTEPGWVRGYRLFFAALTIVAIVWQYFSPGGPKPARDRQLL